MITSALTKIQTKNFRNLEHKIIEFKQRIICFYGDNAQGKTNLLEAIYYFFCHKSFKKKADFPQLLAIDGDKAEITIAATVSMEKEAVYGTVKSTADELEHYFNHQKIKRNPLKNTLYVLLPTDSHAFMTDRTSRISWLDREISRFEKGYTMTLARYQKGIRQRNQLLSSNFKDRAQLKALTLTLSNYSAHLMERRRAYLAAIQEPFQQNFFKLFAENAQIGLEYHPSFKKYQTAEQIAEFWNTQIEEEIVRHQSKYGCHLDDVVIKIDGFSAQEHASMGQQKMAYFSLFFATISHLNPPYNLTHQPIVLLDDISSEIDSRRWKSLIKYMVAQHFQVFITTANKTFLETLKSESGADVVYLENGCMKESLN